MPVELPHKVFVVEVESFSKAGCVIFAVNVAVQLLASLMVTVYVPATTFIKS